jgi:hypothetical protein
MTDKKEIAKEFGHLDHFGKEKVFTIMRRIDHLSERVGQSPDRRLNYDRLELSALNWALKYIKEKFW